MEQFERKKVRQRDQQKLSGVRRFAYWLRSNRVRLGLSQAELARELRIWGCFVTQTRLCRAETIVTKRIDAELVNALQKVFGSNFVPTLDDHTVEASQSGIFCIPRPGIEPGPGGIGI
jgi:transcriptional regulator with XRE-family HTH domain